MDEKIKYVNGTSLTASTSLIVIGNKTYLVSSLIIFFFLEIIKISVWIFVLISMNRGNGKIYITTENILYK